MSDVCLQDTLRKFYWPAYYPEAQEQRYINIDGRPFDRIVREYLIQA